MKITQKMTSAEVENFLNYMIQNGRVMANSGRIPISLEIQGAPGLGKTELCAQVAKKNGFKFVKISLAQYSDNGDMLGSPIRTQCLAKDGIEKWVALHNVVDYKKNGWVEVEGTNIRTEYCKPAWIANENEPIMLLLDDWTRATPDFMQACMELILSHTFTSWALPKGSMVILTSNPADGDMQVAELDAAQRTRFMTVEMKWDKDAWAAWAEDYGIDGRCINFVLHEADDIFGSMLENNPELKEKINARTMTMFFNSIMSITGDYSAKENNIMVSTCGISSVGQEFTNLFMAFIKNKLDRIPQPRDMYEMADTSIFKALEDICNDKSGFRHDIATMLSTRLVNYSRKRIDDKEWKPKDCDRLVKLLTNDKIFKEGQAFFVTRNLATDPKYGKNFQAMYRDPMLAKALLA